jgi:hypothetical protein
VDWIGVALALVGIGISLLPLADQFKFLEPYALPGGVVLIFAGLLLCLVPIWKRIQVRREAKRAPIPLIIARRSLRLIESLRYLEQSVVVFSDVITTLASAGRITVYGIPGEVYRATRELTEIPARHFEDNSLWVADLSDGRHVSETTRRDGEDWSDAGRYFSLAVSPNILHELTEYAAHHPPEEVAQRAIDARRRVGLR